MSEKKNLIKKNKGELQFSIILLICMTVMGMVAFVFLLDLLNDFNISSSDDVNGILLYPVMLMFSILLVPYSIKEIIKNNRELKKSKQ